MYANYRNVLEQVYWNQLIVIHTALPTVIIRYAIISKLIWRSNILLTGSEYADISNKLATLTSYINILKDEIKGKHEISFDEFDFDHKIDKGNIILSAESIVLRKIVSTEYALKKTLQPRLGSACGVVFFDEYTSDAYVDVMKTLDELLSPGDKIQEIQIKSLDDFVQRELRVYGAPPFVFIGTEYIPPDDLSNSEKIKSKLAICRGKTWS